ncbi:MAG: PA0069 family radical SAM protein [Planctomycetota bacterium]
MYPRSITTRQIDARRLGHARGRGASINPPNRFETLRLDVLDEHREHIKHDIDAGVQVLTEVEAETSRTIINRVDSPDMPFNWTINPYRGCEHGCAYCYARPSHEHLGFSCGLDFETRIVARRDAPDLLRHELARPRWTGEPIVLSGVTDAYQPLERRLRITRSCLEIMAACGQPVSIVTKNHLVTRDVELLRLLAERQAARVMLSITTLDTDLARRLEPRASAPADRLRAVETLSQAGVPVGIMMAPIVPGLTDHEIAPVLRAAANAGAHTANWVMLRLPYQVESVFTAWLERWYPDRRSRVLKRLRETFGGRTYSPRFGRRLIGDGPWTAQIRETFDLFANRYGLTRQLEPLSSASFRRPALDGQLDLFAD